MTTLQIELPDVLAQSAQAARLLTLQAVEAMLSEQLKRQSSESLRTLWASAPLEELTPEIERMIDDHVLACVFEARPHLIASSDQHLHSLGGNHQGARIVRPAETIGLLEAM